MPDAGIGAARLACEVVPRPKAAWRLGRGPVRVHVVPRSCVHALALTCLVLPGPKAAWRLGC